MKWENPEEWGGWNMCQWNARHSEEGASWMCVLPADHTGPHLGLLDWESEPYHENNRVERNGVWVPGEMCYYCNRRHPGFRHANDTDPTVVAANDEGWWEPQPNAQYQNADARGWAELFVPDIDPFVQFPTPPKFNTVEEVEAWLDTHAST